MKSFHFSSFHMQQQQQQYKKVSSNAARKWKSWDWLSEDWIPAIVYWILKVEHNSTQFYLSSIIFLLPIYPRKSTWSTKERNQLIYYFVQNLKGAILKKLYPFLMQTSFRLRIEQKSSPWSGKFVRGKQKRSEKQKNAQ